MTLQTRWYLAGWATYTELGWDEPFPGKATALFKYIPLREGQTTGAVEEEVTPFGVVALTYDDAIATQTDIDADFAALDGQSDVAGFGSDIDQPWSVVPNQGRIVSKLAQMNLNVPDLPTGGSIRGVIREIARHILVYAEVGAPKGGPNTVMGSEFAETVRRMRERGYPLTSTPTMTMKRGPAYKVIVQGSSGRFGLRSGNANFGRQGVSLA